MNDFRITEHETVIRSYYVETELENEEDVEEWWHKLTPQEKEKYLEDVYDQDFPDVEVETLF